MPDYAPGLVDGWWNGGCCFQKGHISFSASLVAAAEATLALSELEAGQMQLLIVVATVRNIPAGIRSPAFGKRFHNLGPLLMLLT